MILIKKKSFALSIDSCNDGGELILLLAFSFNLLQRFIFLFFFQRVIRIYVIAFTFTFFFSLPILYHLKQLTLRNNISKITKEVIIVL